MRSTVKCYLGLGSNLGDRLLNLHTAVDLINAHKALTITKLSSWIENPAIDDAGPDDFLNGVVELDCALEPRALAQYIQFIEQEIDPERSMRGRKKARKIDIDILLYGDEVINDEILTVPHPRMKERAFVMTPLLEIYPDYATQIQLAA